MPRKSRAESPTGIYHWIVRGMNRKKLFHKLKDYEFFHELLLQYKQQFDLEIYHYCFMPNHCHLLVHARALKALSQFSHFVQRRFAYFYCKEYKWNGSVFRQGYRSFPISKESYLLECGRYIERNPIKAKIVLRPEDYGHTSYRFYTQGETSKLLTYSPAFLGLAADELARREIYAKHVTEHRVQEEMMQAGLLPTGVEV